MNKIKELRLNLKMNQTAFAKSIGIGQTYLSQMESGDREISVKVAYAIQKKYSIPMDKMTGKEKIETIDISALKREIELLKELIQAQKLTIQALTKKH